MTQIETRGSRWDMPLIVFLAGAGTLGLEMIASRLLAPYFGTSQPIWAAIIGMTLIYLALGYHIGGRIADQRPDARQLYRIVLLSSLMTALIPLIARPILRGARSTLANIDIGGFLGALLAVLLLFAAPLILLAMVSPFAIRLHLSNRSEGVNAAGRTAGTLSALSTLGSIIGTFLTVMVLIPGIGTTQTLLLFTGLLAISGFLGLRSRRAVLILAIIVLLGAGTLIVDKTVKPAGCRDCVLVAESESAYNYIQVAERTSAEGRQRVLLLNEGLAVHSSFNLRFAESGESLDLLTGGGPWDYFAITPFFYPNRDPASITSLAMLGAGAGTASAQFLAIYGSEVTVDAVEIDPQILELGRQFFGLRDRSVDPAFPRYQTYAQDARYFLATTPRTYDIVAIDAYHQPYIPFHLTTVEFFGLVHGRLNPDGVAVINCGLGRDGDDRLGQAIAATMRRVFPQVYIIETGHGSNQILVGVTRDVGHGWDNMIANYERMTNPSLRMVIESVQVRERPIDPRASVLTDDHAPIEALVDSLILKTALPGRSRGRQ